MLDGLLLWIRGDFSFAARGASRSARLDCAAIASDKRSRGGLRCGGGARSGGSGRGGVLQQIDQITRGNGDLAKFQQIAQECGLLVFDRKLTTLANQDRAVLAAEVLDPKPIVFEKLDFSVSAADRIVGDRDVGVGCASDRKSSSCCHRSVSLGDATQGIADRRTLSYLRRSDYSNQQLVGQEMVLLDTTSFCLKRLIRLPEAPKNTAVPEQRSEPPPARKVALC